MQIVVDVVPKPVAEIGEGDFVRSTYGGLTRVVSVERSLGVATIERFADAPIQIGNHQSIDAMRL